jgi:hypothetical protein
MGLKSLVCRKISFLVPLALTSLILGGGSSALATMTWTGVSTQSVSSTDLTDLTKPIVFGGIAGTCTADANNSATCDSCDGVTNGKISVCNKNNIYPNLKVVITLQTATTGFVDTDFYIESGSNSKSNFINHSVVSGGTLTAILTWGEICEVLGQANCANEVSGEVTIGLKNTTANISDSIVVTFRTRIADVNADTTYTDCDTAAGTGGACHYKALRGDEKIYADDLVFVSGYPTSAVSGIPFKDVLIFYETKDGASEADDTTLINTLSNKSAFASFGATASASPPVNDNRVTGLKNGQRYCTMMANRDAAGVISFFTPSAILSDSSLICATPTKVVGLLDDKSCFIATAAFGSSMAPEVESFRQFRNHFLLSNPVGKAFVRFYYAHSPYYANLIAESEVAKAVVRAALWPLLIFARVTLVFGFWLTVAFFGLGALGIFEIYRRFFLGRRFRGEL